MTTNTGRNSGSFTKEALLIDGWDFNEQKYARVRRASEEGRPAAQASPAQPSHTGKEAAGNKAEKCRGQS